MTLRLHRGIFHGGTGSWQALRMQRWWWKQVQAEGPLLQPILPPATTGTYLPFPAVPATRIAREIGKGSWRERVCQYVLISVVAESLKKNNRHKQTDRTICKT